MPHDPLQDPPPGTSPSEHAEPPVMPIQSAGPFRRVLSVVLSAAAVLGLMLMMIFVVLPRLSQVPRPAKDLPSSSAAEAAAPPVPVAALPPLSALPPAKTAADGQTPLAVALYSAGSGKHVFVGKPVLISAYAALPPAGSATIAISYTRNGGSRSLLTLAQGSLSTASWTPAAPGRYEFTASALDSRKISAFSHSLVIVADTAPVSPFPAVAITAPPPTRNAAQPPVLRAFSAPRRIATRSLPAMRSVSATRSRFVTQPAPKRPSVQTSHLKPFHVAAAAFVVRPVAETLAGALRRRGFHAFVRETSQPHHKPTYVVETGKFLRPADAKKQLYTLNHDGYPAFISQ